MRTGESGSADRMPDEIMLSPRRMASDSWQAARVDSGSGFWWLSIAIPPKSCSATWNLRSVYWEKVSRTRTACAVTSGPCLGRETQSQSESKGGAAAANGRERREGGEGLTMPSPGRATILYALVDAMLCLVSCGRIRGRERERRVRSGSGGGDGVRPDLLVGP